MTPHRYPTTGWRIGRRVFMRILLYAFLISSSLLMLYPVLFTVLGAFTTNERFAQAVFLPIPNTLSLNRFLSGFRALQHAYLVTLLRVGFYIGVTTLVSLIGGYVFSKLRFRGRNQVFLVLLLGMVMPPILMLLPQFLQVAWWPLAGGNNWLGQGGHGLIGQWPVLFVYGWVPPFGIFLLKQNYDMLPTEYEEAARLEGAGLGTIIFRVYGPLLMPALAALITITFLAMWNDYLWPLLTISGNPEWHPISFRVGSVRSFSVVGGSPGAMVQFLLAMWPPAAVYLVFQRYFVQGLVASGMKG